MSNESVTDQEKGVTPNPDTRELSILITDADKYGNDLSAMSDFFGNAITQMSRELSTSRAVETTVNIPVADFAILNDVIRHAEVVMKGAYHYVPDFDHLPQAIKAKLDKGLYTIGESRQVDGNYRAVILNEKGIRVKDVTLKKIANDPGTLATTRSIATQLQLKQIYEKLSEIQEMQSYQIDRDRDHVIRDPFFNARACILRAQETPNPATRKANLEEAAKELTRAITAIYTDIDTSSNHLVKLTRFPIFRNQPNIKQYLSFITWDIQTLPLYVGMLTQVFDYLGDHSSSKLEIEKYRHAMSRFFSQKIEGRKISLAELVHQTFPYNADNLNYWLNLSEQMKPALARMTAAIDDKPTIIVALEDVQNEE